MKYKWKKIWLNTKRTKYCIVRVYDTLEQMQYKYKALKINKQQYPFILNSMKEEEILLYNYSYAIVQFYNWYCKTIDNGMA